MITILIGKTCSGKNTILEELVKMKYQKVVTYTTRPKRKGEVEDDTYHYISEEDFKQKIDNGFFAEYDSFNTNEGVWYYGSAEQDYHSKRDKIIILTPAGLSKIKDKEYGEVFSIYLYANRKTISERLKQRKDKKEEAIRRMKHDDEDFAGAVDKVDKIVYNNIGANPIDVAKKIDSLIKARKKVKS